jgi:Sec-independent protein secretion pathway component TatC
MKTAALIIACFAGQFAFAFLLTGFALLARPTRESRGSQELPNAGVILFLLFDGFVLEGAVTTLLGMVASWPKMPDARKFVYAGAVCSLITAVALLWR